MVRNKNMKKDITLSNSMKKFIIIYYSLAIIFGIYNLYESFLSHPSTLEGARLGFVWGDLFVMPMGIAIFVLSIILIVKVFKKKLPKLYLIYPIYYIGMIIIAILLIPILHTMYDLSRTFFIIDSLRVYHKYLYMFDLILSIFVLCKLFPELPKKIAYYIKEHLNI